MIDDYGWHGAAQKHFARALRVLQKCGCDVGRRAHSPLWWAELYRFLTYEHLITHYDTSYRTGPLKSALAPAQRRTRLLYSAPAQAYRCATDPPLAPGAFFLPGMLTAPAHWDENGDPEDDRLTNVWMTWRAYCPTFPATEMCRRLFRPQPGRAVLHSASCCAYCSARCVELLDPAKKTWVTPEFEKFVLEPVFAAMDDNELVQLPLWGPLKERKAPALPVLVVCAAGHFFYFQDWNMLDNKAVTQFNNPWVDSESDEDEGEEGEEEEEEESSLDSYGF